MNERTQIAAKLTGSHIFLILAMLVISFFIKTQVLLYLAVTQTTLLILFLAGYWEFFGLRFKMIFCGIIELMIWVAFFRKLFYAAPETSNLFLCLIFTITGIFLGWILVKILMVINSKDRSAVELNFPFREGSYLVTDGGNSRISRFMNYHFYSRVHKKKKTNLSMLFAVDIVKLEKGKPGFLPLKNDSYPVFGEKVYSPMEGVVVKSENNIPDNEPFSGNYPYNTGNTVVIRQGNMYLLLGHLMQGSIVVKEGDQVHAREPIGAAGNSGWTERPHLHMQLIKSDSENYWFGEGISILYKKRNLYKNRLIKMPFIDEPRKS
jgi:hypothetical protein